MFITMRMVVVLPAPLGPSRPRTAPWRTRRLTPLTAITDSYDFVTFSSAIASMNSLLPGCGEHRRPVYTGNRSTLLHSRAARLGTDSRMLIRQALAGRFQTKREKENPQDERDR